MIHRWFDGEWHSEDLGGHPTAPAAASRGIGKLMFLQKGQITGCYIVTTKMVIRAVENLGATMYGAPSSVASLNDNLLVFFCGPDHNIFLSTGTEIHGQGHITWVARCLVILAFVQEISAD